jgi:hypothetical protein
MDLMPLSPERKAQLDDYAQRRGQDPEHGAIVILEWLVSGKAGDAGLYGGNPHVCRILFAIEAEHSSRASYSPRTPRTTSRAELIKANLNGPLMCQGTRQYRQSRHR